MLVCALGDVKPLLLLNAPPFPARYDHSSECYDFTLFSGAALDGDSAAPALNLLEWLLYRFLAQTDLSHYNAIRLSHRTPSHALLISLSVVLYHIIE